MTYILDDKTVIAADLDGTLVQSKSEMTGEMAAAISKWLSTNRFVIISGGGYENFKKQAISVLPSDTRFENLFLFPTNGAACYAFKNGTWEKLYEETLNDNEARFVESMIHEAIEKSGIIFDETFGPQIENRGGQITFSALGQDAPLAKKVLWDPDQSKRRYITTYLVPRLADFKVGIGGTTSIDITKKGTDKAFAIARMKQILDIDNEHVIFFGDALFPGGNDFPATTTGITCIEVINPDDTLQKMSAL